MGFGYPRRERKTPRVGGLTLYQWLCIAISLAGIAITVMPSPAVQAALTLDGAAVAVALALAAAATLAMSIDWPQTNFPLSRLSAPASVEATEARSSELT